MTPKVSFKPESQPSLLDDSWVSNHPWQYSNSSPPARPPYGVATRGISSLPPGLPPSLA
jgi:hypothetical protein